MSIVCVQITGCPRASSCVITTFSCSPLLHVHLDEDERECQNESLLIVEISYEMYWDKKKVYKKAFERHKAFKITRHRHSFESLLDRALELPMDLVT